MTKKKFLHGGRRKGSGRESDREFYGEPTVPVMVRLPRSLHRRISGIPGASLGRKIVALLQNGKLALTP